MLNSKLHACSETNLVIKQKLTGTINIKDKIQLVLILKGAEHKEFINQKFKMTLLSLYLLCALYLSPSLNTLHFCVVMTCGKVLDDTMIVSLFRTTYAQAL